MVKKKDKEKLTTIAVTFKTRDRFWKFQEHYKENADDILNKLMFNYKKKVGGKNPDYVKHID